ncbi:hypothetical protein CLAIMM_00700 [Cladophialophora immunda]|nr:hypothetical protein CLAIMM_00700 [Cladophialophora immunda]
MISQTTNLPLTSTWHHTRRFRADTDTPTQGTVARVCLAVHYTRTGEQPTSASQVSAIKKVQTRKRTRTQSVYETVGVRTSSQIKPASRSEFGLRHTLRAERRCWCTEHGVQARVVAKRIDVYLLPLLDGESLSTQ